MIDILTLIFFILFFLLFGITVAIQSVRAIKRQTDKEKHKWEYRSGPHDW